MTILKEHISYSEIRQWKECPWRHKLLYIDKLSTFEESPHLHYGTIVHDACEHFLKTKELKLEQVKNNIAEVWDEHGFDSESFIRNQTEKAKSQGWTYKHSKIEDWQDWAISSIKGLPEFLENTFPDWEFVSAEDALYECIDNTSTKFKGFIDCIIKVKSGSKEKYVIIDWKTSSGRGWPIEKQRDFLVQSQLILYKHFWGTKNNIDMKNIQCAFVLLKKIKNPEKSCQLIKVSSGPKSLEKSTKMINNMIKTVERQIFMKNRNSCKFCEFQGTTHCKIVI